MATPARLPADWIGRLDLPLIVAPMFLVSTVAMVVAACRNGAIGALPAANARNPDILRIWMEEIASALAPPRADGRAAAPWALNLVAHRTNRNLPALLDLCVEHRVPLVITALGSPRVAVDPVHSYGGLVFADVNAPDLARKAVDAGADGLVLIASGAGGHTGTMAAPAFLSAVRQFWNGPIVIAGGLTRGAQLRGMQAMGADLAYMGTRFIAATQSDAVHDYKHMVIESTFADIVATAAVTGALANKLRPSLIRAGLDPDNLKPRRFDLSNQDEDVKAWKDLWSAGHGVGDVRTSETTEAILERLRAEYRSAIVAERSDPWAERYA